MIRTRSSAFDARAFAHRGTLLVFVVLVAVTGSAQAQEPAAHPTIVLPPVVVAGKPATLAVLDAQGRPAANVQVSLGAGDVTLNTDATGRAALTAPDAQGVLVARLPDGSEASTTVVAAPANEPAGVRIDSVARTLLLHDRFTIRGAGFHGAADQNRVLLGGQPVAILAASPAAIVALPNPRTDLGETQLAIEHGNTSIVTGPVTVIALEVTSERSKGAPGETGQVHVQARGTDRPVDFEVRASPPGRIELAHGNPARGRTSGGAANTASLAFTFRQPGEFSLEIRVVPAPLGLPDTEAAKKELQQALILAPVAYAKQVEHAIDLLGKREHVSQAREAIESLLAKSPEGDFGAHLKAAWHILANPD